MPCILSARDITILYPVGLASLETHLLPSQQHKQILRSTIATNLQLNGEAARYICCFCRVVSVFGAFAVSKQT